MNVERRRVLRRSTRDAGGGVTPRSRGRPGDRAARRRETPLTDQAHPEALLISSVVQTGDLSTPVDYGVESEVFHAHRQVWEWLEKFHKKHGKTPDKPTFRSQFPDFPLLKTTDVDYASESVMNNHLRHALANSVKEATSLLASNRPEDALTKMKSTLNGVQDPEVARNTNVLEDTREVFQEAARRAEAANNIGLAGVDTGFATVNDRTGGVHPGDLWITAARLGGGKTWLLTKMATEAVVSGKRVVFVSLEQTKAQITFRLHTMLANRFGYSLKNRELMSGVNLDLNYYRGFLADLPSRVNGEFYVLDPSRGRVNPYTLSSIIERLEPDIVFVDYITLMQKESDEWQGVAKLSAECKEVALTHHTPIVAAAQINRLGEGGKKPPGVDKLAQSDSIGQDADVVITMRKFSNKARQLLLAKNRSGSDDIVFYAEFDPDEGRFNEIDYEEAMSLQAEAAMEEDE